VLFMCSVYVNVVCCVVCLRFLYVVCACMRVRACVCVKCDVVLCVVYWRLLCARVCVYVVCVHAHVYYECGYGESLD